MENLRQFSMALNGGKGIALHWFTTEDSYANPQRFFEPIWKVGRAGDDSLHYLLRYMRAGACGEIMPILTLQRHLNQDL